MKEKLSVLALVLITVSFIITLGIPIATSSPTSPRGPIYIVGDNSFTSSNGVTGGSGTQSDPYIIEGWAINASSTHGIGIENTTEYFIIRNCLVENSAYAYAHGGYYAGIYLYNVVNGRIENNICRNNYFGIVLGPSSYNTLSGNTCSNNGGGIYLGASSYNTLTGNYCSNNYNGDGIYLYSSSYNTLTGNTCENNGDGIYLDSSSNNTFTNNTCENNSMGIYLLPSSNNNTTTLNYLLNNAINNAEDGGTNTWDNGSVGNYWSDWQSPDNNGDGIVDNPRPITGGSNIDHYPLVITSITTTTTPLTTTTTTISPITTTMTTTTTLTTTTTPSQQPHNLISINGNSQFTSANGIVSGSGTASDPYTIESWVISAASANGITIQNTTAYFIIRNCLVENGGSTYYGIYSNNVINGRIENNTCENNYYCIYLDSSSNYNTLTGNTCENNTSHWYEYGFDRYRGYGIYLNSSSNNTLTNNNCSNNTNNGIYLNSSSNNTLTNNICRNNIEGISLYSSSNYNTLTGNTCENNTSHGIRLSDSSNNNLTGNYCSNNGNGIYVYSSSSNTLTSNNCENNSYGISLYFSSNNTLVGNTCSNNNNYYGIYLASSSSNTLTNNICRNNSDCGIRLNSSSNNTLSGNTCSNNDYGIYLLSSSSYNTLSGNTCENNSRYGIFLKFSSNNTIVLNLLNNTENNAYDDGNNSWNKDGYGNYWSDWQSPDANNNGVVDNPRPITGGSNIDHYPLILTVNISASTGGNFPINVVGTNVTINVLVVQPNSLSEDTSITVQQKPPENVADHAMLSYVFDVGPNGTNFTDPVTLTLPYQLQSGVSEDNLAIYSYNTDSSSWERIGGTVNKVDKTVSVQINHLSEYAVMAELAAGGGMPLAVILAVAGVALLVAVSAAWVGLRKSRDEVTSELVEHGLHGMSLQEADIFRVIKERKEFTIVYLMHETGASKTIARRTIQKLIKKGLVQPTEKTIEPVAGRGKPSTVYKYVGD